MNAAVSPDGVLMVTKPAGSEGIDVRQAILAGAQVTKQAFRVELSSLTSAMFVRI